MAITVTDRGTGGDSTPGTSFVVSPSSTMAAGSIGILVISMDNASGATTNLTQATGTGSYTDSVGNIWYVRTSGVGGSANAAAEGQVLTSLLTHSFSSVTPDTLTINVITSTTAKTWALIEASSNLTGGMIFYVSQTAFSAGVSTGTPSLANSNFVANGDLVIGAGCAQSGDTWAGDADTLNGSWSTMQHTGTGSGATGVSIITQWKVVNAVGAQTYNPTLTTAVTRLVLLGLRETDSHTRVLAGSGAAETSGTITFLLPLAANSIGVLCMSLDNSVSGGGTVQLASSFTDSRSNTWTLRQNAIDDPAAANAAAEIGIYTSVLTTALVVGDTMTWSVSTTAVGFKVWAGMEFAPTVGGSAMTYVTGGVTASLPTTPASSLSITTGSITSGDYVVACLAAEAIDNMTGDSDTTNGTWSVPIGTAAGAAIATGQTVFAQWKKVTTGGTQTYDVTSGDGSVDYIMGWVQIHDASPTGGLTASQKAAFFQMF